MISTDEIEKQRQKLIGEFMECMNAVIVKLRDSDDCSFECSSMMLGALIKGLGSQDIPFPLPTAPYLGYSLSSLKTSTAGFKRLEWSNKNHKCSPPPSSKVNSGLHGTNTISSGHFSSNTFSTNSFGSSFGNSSLGNQVNSVKQEAAKDKCDCNLASLIVPTMDKIERRILGWPVEDFPKSSEEDQ